MEKGVILFIGVCVAYFFTYWSIVLLYKLSKESRSNAVKRRCVCTFGSLFHVIIVLLLNKQYELSNMENVILSFINVLSVALLLGAMLPCALNDLKEGQFFIGHLRLAFVPQIVLLVFTLIVKDLSFWYEKMQLLGIIVMIGIVVIFSKWLYSWADAFLICSSIISFYILGVDIITSTCGMLIISFSLFLSMNMRKVIKTGGKKRYPFTMFIYAGYVLSLLLSQIFYFY